MHANPAVIEIDDYTTPGTSRFASPDDGLSTFLGARSRLFGIAYRMLGSAAEAEDVVQDVWVRWQTTDRSPVRSPLAFLVTATTRLAINVLQSARARRETYAGPSLPEPVDTERRPGPGSGTWRGVEPCGPAPAGEAVAHGTRRVRASRGFRLSLPRHCQHPSARRSQRAASGDPRSAARRDRPPDAGEFDRGATSSRCVRRRNPDGRHRQAREDSWRWMWSCVHAAASLEGPNRSGGRSGCTLPARRCVRARSWMKSHCGPGRADRSLGANRATCRVSQNSG